VGPARLGAARVRGRDRQTRVRGRGFANRDPAPRRRGGAVSQMSGQSRGYASRLTWLVVSAQMMMMSSAITMMDQIG
jgi:hypothetical protein